MKYRIGHFEYNEDRTGNPYLFTVIGTPELKADWEKHRGETRQTMTLAEVEAAGIALPDAIGASVAVAAKRVDALTDEIANARADCQNMQAEVDRLNAKLEAARLALQ